MSTPRVPPPPFFQQLSLFREQSKAALGSAFLALVLNPAVQKRAQAEIDVVVGRGRLPDFGDYENLPYVNAVCMEVKRWHPVVPLGMYSGFRG